MIVGGLTLDAYALEPRWIAIDHVDLPIKDLPKDFEGYKILHLTDTHCGPYIDPQLIRESIKDSLKLKPDLIVFTGDLVDGHGPVKLPDLKYPFQDVSAPDGQFLVLGNHDAWRNGKMVRKAVADETPFKSIENQNVRISRGKSEIALVGLGDLWTGELNFDKAFRGIPDHMPRILLQHNPDLAEEMPSEFNVSMQLSGHTHGGQIRMPWGFAPRVPSRYGNKFREGIVQGARHMVYVCRGIGAVGPWHPRLFCRPQISLLTLRTSHGFPSE